VPFGPVFAVMGIAISLVLLFQLELRQVALMSITAAIATANWCWARRSTRKAPSEELRGVY